ncbi:MlaD family protein [Nocardia nova]|uniref:MlaD family protein n=1 Tax=Nocardia nova TaxID=37330 RepID=UPI0033FD3EC6
MPTYGMPGVPIQRGRARVIGASILAAAVVAAATIRLVTGGTDRDDLEIQLRTEQIGDGVVVGSPVRAQGVPVGEVVGVDSVGDGRQKITISLARNRVTELTDNFNVDYAPENLFGITTLSLEPRDGGAPLRSGELLDLSGPNAARVNDVTMGALLRMVSQTTDTVLTPKLTQLITQLNTGMQAFTPLVQAMVSVSEIVADTQRYLPAYVMSQMGVMLNGAGEYSSATFHMFHDIYHIDTLQPDKRPLFDTAIDVLSNKTLPTSADLLFAAQPYFDSYVQALTPLVQATATSTGAQSGQQIHELLDRLEAMFSDTPDGPALNIDIVLHALPGVVVPLLGLQSAPTQGGLR